jgi:DNA-binding CsgD family transcriptional regulator
MDPERMKRLLEQLGCDPESAEAARIYWVVGHLHERELRVLALSVDGCGLPEISRQLGATDRTVYRILRRLRDRLGPGDEPPGPAGAFTPTGR